MYSVFINRIQSLNSNELTFDIVSHDDDDDDVNVILSSFHLLVYMVLAYRKRCNSLKNSKAYGTMTTSQPNR